MIVTLTMNPAVDKSTSIEKIVPEKKLRCSDLLIEPGGGGINVSKAIKELGGSSLAVFPSGGTNGKILEEKLHALSIDFKAVPIQAETRENLVVHETAGNVQYRFVLPGAAVEEAAINACVDILQQLQPAPTFIVASGSLPPGVPENFFGRLAVLAHQLGAKFIVDSSGKPLQMAVAEGVYLLKPNLSELCALAGTNHLELNEVDEAALSVIRKGKCKVMVVSMGPNGALLVSENGYEHIPAPAVKKQSTVGAGDSMVAGMVWMLSQQKSLSEMARFGVACGTAATMNYGTQLFKREDVFKLYDWINKYAEKYKLPLH